ncbi:ABC transporter permease subunit [Thorsellia kenyensis]|uniref:ABC transporter permease subunit n=1 Tax=Thorsellia kenyensis TaxID=1549888 RepID=A0ABV6CB82_9GAMM
MNQPFSEGILSLSSLKFRFRQFFTIFTYKNLIIGIPFAWLIIFFALPFVIVLKISFAELARAMPPYTDLFDLEEGVLSIYIHFSNYIRLLQDGLYGEVEGGLFALLKEVFTENLYLKSYLHSLAMALYTTVLCILIGYPLAWAVANSHASVRNILLLLIILPSWTSFLVRIYAVMGIISDNGFLNNALIYIGVIDEPLKILRTNAAVLIGMVYAYLPFMILPIYNAMIKLDYTCIEAAQDLGAKPFTIFRRVMFPLTRGGIIAGSMLVFIPTVGEYVIPELLGASNNLLIGGVLSLEFFNNRDWPMAATLAVVMLLILIVPIIAFHRFQRRNLS